jgi:hypothetical protein
MNNYVPPALTGLLNMSTIMTPTSGMQSDLDNTQPLNSYAAGGMVGPGGAPIRPNLPGMPGLSAPSTGQGGMGPQQMELEARRFVQQNPQQVAEIREAIEEALAEGDITMDQVQILTNMAKVALQNPEMYPALKQSIVARGILEEDELPPDFDQGTLFILLLIGQIMQSPAQPGLAAGGSSGPAAAPAPVAAPGSAQPMPVMEKGGPLPSKSKNADGSVMIIAHENEYVIPAKVVRAKGTEFFDKLLQNYADDED